MKKIYIVLILGILLVGVVSSITFGLNKEDFDKKIHKIDAEELCEKMSGDKKEKHKKCKDKDYEVSLNDTDIEIKENPEGVLMVRHK